MAWSSGQLSLTAGILATSPARATPPEHVEGTTQIIGTDADGNYITEYYGDLEGLSVTYPGEGAAGLLVCYCTLLGQGDGSPIIVRIVEPRGDGTGTFTVLAASGEMEGLHGRGTWALDLETLAGAYAGWFHFDPAD